MDAAMPDTICTAAGREIQAFFLNRHRTPSSGIAAAHQATFASRPTSPTNHARPSHHHGRCFKLSKHAMGHNAGDQRLAALDDPHRPVSSRVRCIALLWRIDHSTGRSRLCALYRVPAFGTTWGGAAEAHRPANGIFFGMAGQGTPLRPRPANRTTAFSRT